MRVREEEAQRHNIGKRAGWGSLAVLVAGLTICLLIWLLIWYGPDVIARHDIGNVTGPLRILRMQQARDAARGRLLTFGAGLFAAGALVFTAWNLVLYRRNLTLYRRTNEISEQGQVTDRYTKAIEQLGSDKLDVRIGGIYALERVARDSSRDHPTVMEVLAAFIREHSHEQWRQPVDEPVTGAPKRATRPDLQAAVTVIGHRNPRHDRQVVNLRGADLGGADLSGADLSGPNLSDAHVTGAGLIIPFGGVDLSTANLTDADLNGADLTRASLTRANLTRAELIAADLDAADLGGADLTGAGLFGANLTGVNLTDADLNGADLTRADLTGANLTGADLTGANLTRAELTAALLSPDAGVPEGWQQESDSGRLKRTDTTSGGAATNELRQLSHCNVLRLPPADP